MRRILGLAVVLAMGCAEGAGEHLAVDNDLEDVDPSVDLFGGEVVSDDLGFGAMSTALVLRMERADCDDCPVTEQVMMFKQAYTCEEVVGTLNVQAAWSREYAANGYDSCAMAGRIKQDRERMADLYAPEAPVVAITTLGDRLENGAYDAQGEDPFFVVLERYHEDRWNYEFTRRSLECATDVPAMDEPDLTVWEMERGSLTVTRDEHVEGTFSGVVVLDDETEADVSGSFRAVVCQDPVLL